MISSTLSSHSSLSSSCMLLGMLLGHVCQLILGDIAPPLQSRQTLQDGPFNVLEAQIGTFVETL